MNSRRTHRQDSSSTTSPSSPSRSIDSSNSSLDSSQSGTAVIRNPVMPRASASNPQELVCLPGETQEAEYTDIEYHCPFSTPSALKGTLKITNYRLFFRPDDSPLILDVPLGFVSKVEKIGRARTSAEGNYGLDIICKDVRNIKFFLNKNKMAEVGRGRKDIFECLITRCFPLSHEQKLFCFTYGLHKEQFGHNTNGWTLYNVQQEFKRQGLQNRGSMWTLSRINEKYALCETYPAILGIPSITAVTEEDLLEVAKFRSKERIPVLSWLHKESGASITRCAQPLVGVTGKTSKADQKLIQQIRESNPQFDKIVIYDARPRVNALANKARGGGYEDEEDYDSMEFVFLDIHNIHVMRESLRRVKDMCFPAIDDQKWLSNLEASQWLDHGKQILSGAVKIVEKVSSHKTSCVVHCSDGWDRTSQLTSLSMLLLDSYYRTLTGFMVLIEKEWLSFGHKFGHRIGHGENEHNDPDRSPVFVQWIDCVWQVTQQFPNAFEFNEYFLTTILDHLYSCLFGTFLYNSEKERKDAMLSENSKSLWSFILSKRPMFLNPMYCGSLDTNKVLSPIASIRYMKFWKGYYCRWNPRMRPQDSVHDRHAQLLSMRDQLQAKVDSLTRELENKNKSKDLALGGPKRQGGPPGNISSMASRFESTINI